MKKKVTKPQDSLQWLVAQAYLAMRREGVAVVAIKTSEDPYGAIVTVDGVEFKLLGDPK